MTNEMITSLGIDVGGSGIKGAVVDTLRGTLCTERHRLETPTPASPAATLQVISEIVTYFGWQGAIGCAFPAVVKQGIVYSAANIDESWIGTNVQELIQHKVKLPVVVMNDADAAGIAEMSFGAGKGHFGVVIVVTVGTGIGSAIFTQGYLLPNTELGHLEIRGKQAEHRASDRARKQQDLSWDEWAIKFNEYLERLEALFSPDLFILGGGISKKHAKYLHLLRTHAQIVPAHLFNNAGIVGAALATQLLHKPTSSLGVVHDSVF